MKISVLFVLGLSCFSSAAYGACPDLDDKINALPNWDSSTLFPCMYSGFIEIDEDSESNIFYWLFKHNDDKKSLVIWLNGGPGASSMGGLFTENGPIRMKKHSNGTVGLHSIDSAWTYDAHVLYVDQPVGTGFSYGGHKVTN